MDAAYYEDLRGELFSLLIMLEDRLGSQDARQAHEFIDVDEYGLALEQMAGVLAAAGTPVTDQERDDMLALNCKMQMDARVPGALQSCPRAGSPPAAGHP
ncbi:MAG: MafI family immunity protein [Streptosporangiaceae bacterium]